MTLSIDIVLGIAAAGVILGVFIAIIARGLFRSLNKWTDLESRADFVLRRADIIDVEYEKIIPKVHRLERALSDAGKFESLYTKQREQADRIDALSRELASAKSELAQLRTRL